MFDDRKIDVGARLVWSKRYSVLCFLAGVHQITHESVGVGKQELGFEIRRVGVEYGESPVLGVLILPAREDDLPEIDLRMPIFRLELNSALQFLNGRGPVALSLVTKR